MLNRCFDVAEFSVSANLQSFNIDASKNSSLPLSVCKDVSEMCIPVKNLKQDNKTLCLIKT